MDKQLHDSGLVLVHSIRLNPDPATTYRADNGSSSSGAFYSYGEYQQHQSGLGELGFGRRRWPSGSSGPASGAMAGWYAVALTNSTSETLDSCTINYDAEQWRDGGNANPQ